MNRVDELKALIGQIQKMRDELEGIKIYIDEVNNSLTKVSSEVVKQINEEKDFNPPEFILYEEEPYRLYDVIRGDIEPFCQYKRLFTNKYEVEVFREYKMKKIKPLTFNSDRRLYDGQPVWCWNNDEISERTIKFYDAINKCTFRYDGKRDGRIFQNYEPYKFSSPELNYWVREAFKKLKF